MDQQMPDDDSDNHNPEQSTSRTAHRGLHFSRTVMASNKIYADLVHAGFRPPQLFQPDRATKRRIRRYEENASEDEDDHVDDDSRDVGQRRRPRRINTSSKNDTGDDHDDAQLNEDAKPRAIDKSLALRSDELSPAVVLHRQQKKLKKTTKTKKVKSPPAEHEPLQLHHRLIEPIGGRKKRKIIVLDANDKNSKATANRKHKQNTPAISTKGNDNINDLNVNDKSAPTTTFEKPVVVELPPLAIIRGSITHKILQKLNRLDSNMVYDDPYQQIENVCNDQNESIINRNDPSHGESTTVQEKMQTPTTIQMNGDTATNVVARNGDTTTSTKRSERNGAPVVVTTNTVCIRSTVIPQMDTQPHTKSLHVVILYGKYRGCTGYVVDEIDGRYFVIQSDDPDDIKKGVTWTVSNTHISTVAEFMAEHQPQHFSTAPLPLKNRMRKSSHGTKTAHEKSSKDYELFMSCLEKELAVNECINSAPHSDP